MEHYRFRNDDKRYFSMKAGQIWSIEFDCYVSQTFMPRKDNFIKLDITNCVIKISIFGIYYLYLKGKEIKKLDFDEFQKYKKYVKEIIDERECS